MFKLRPILVVAVIGGGSLAASFTFFYRLPKVFAEAHSFVYLPRLVYASMPHGAEMIFTWAHLWDGVVAAAAMLKKLRPVRSVNRGRCRTRWGLISPYVVAIILTLT
jgi:hypothetical protein